MIQLSFDVINKDLKSRGGVKHAIDADAKKAKTSYKLPIGYESAFEIDDKYRNRKRVLSFLVNKKLKNQQLILKPDQTLEIIENEKIVKSFKTIFDYLAYLKKMELESLYIKNDHNVVISNNDFMVISNHWLLPSKENKKIVVENRQTNEKIGYRDIEDFLKSEYADLIFLP